MDSRRKTNSIFDGNKNGRNPENPNHVCGIEWRVEEKENFRGGTQVYVSAKEGLTKDRQIDIKTI